MGAKIFGWRVFLDLKIGIVDYGMGNILSLKSALIYICPNADIFLAQDRKILDKVDLIFSKRALDEIVNIAVKRKTGARALRSVLENIMLNIMYEIPSKKNIKSCTINYDVIKNNLVPNITYFKKSA